MPTRHENEVTKRLKKGGRRMRVTMTVVAPPGATLRDVDSFLYDLEWVGGCRHPQEDFMFESLRIESSTVRMLRR